jgi:hypothetical protein
MTIRRKKPPSPALGRRFDLMILNNLANKSEFITYHSFQKFKITINDV